MIWHVWLPFRLLPVAIRRWVAAAGLCTSCFLAIAADAEPRHVLLLTDSSSAPAEILVTAGIREGLGQSLDEVEIYAETLDATRFPTPEQRAVIADFLRAKYADRRIEAALAIGPSSLTFLAERRATLFPDSPIVYGGVRESSVPTDLRNSTGVVSSFDLLRTLELALALQPDARSLVVITGAGALDASWNAFAREKLEPYLERLAITYLAGLPKSVLLEEVGRLPRDTIVVFLTMTRDGAGQFFVAGRELAREIAEASTAPVYGVYDTYVGQGVVGGYVESFEAMGDLMAASTLRVLGGEPVAEVAPVASKSVYVVDWRALRRWNLDEARLPPDTRMTFRDPSLWAQYRVPILGVTSLLALQSLLIVALLLYIRKRRVERTLRQTEDRYHHMVESQIDLVCRYAPDTTLTFVSDTYCRYFGRTREELIGRRFIDFVPEPEQQRVLERVRSLVDDVRTVSYMHQVTMSDGSMHWQQWLDHPIVDAQGKVFEIQGIGRDITDLKAAETEAQQRREQVTHLTRVAILGELSGALAHELNQPITAILSNAQTAELLLRQPAPDLAELREIVKDIVADDVRAGEIIRRLRTMLKPGATVFQSLDITSLLGEVLVMVRAQLLEQHVALVELFAGPLPPVHGDRVQLQQVLVNLVMNACEAMRDNEPSDRTLVARASYDKGFVSVAVSDSGAGFPPHIGERLFEPFFTTKTEGLGLGLSICRSIVSLHSGWISARNNPDRGATVEFVLPVTQADLRHGEHDEHLRSDGFAETLRVSSGR
jgi:PAS domain S-box-containing protein